MLGETFGFEPGILPSASVRYWQRKDCERQLSASLDSGDIYGNLSDPGATPVDGNIYRILDAFTIIVIIRYFKFHIPINRENANSFGLFKDMRSLFKFSNPELRELLNCNSVLRLKKTNDIELKPWTERDT